MSITLDLEPELEARVAARAAAQGVPMEEFLETVLAQMLLPLPDPIQQPISLEEFDALMDEFAEGSDGTPSPPILSREDIYGDHD